MKNQTKQQQKTHTKEREIERERNRKTSQSLRAINNKYSRRKVALN